MADWKAPAMPPLPDGQSKSDVLLLNPLGETTSRAKREANATAPAETPAANGEGQVELDLNGPTLPPLPPFALLLSPAAPWSGETKDNDWYAPQMVQRQARSTANTPALDLSRPALPPVSARILLPF